MKSINEKVLAFVITLLICILILQFGHAAVSQPTSQQSMPGRYQLVGIDINSAYIIDTTTGQTWRRNAYGGAPWEKQASLLQR